MEIHDTSVTCLLVSQDAELTLPEGPQIRAHLPHDVMELLFKRFPQ